MEMAAYDSSNLFFNPLQDDSSSLKTFSHIVETSIGSDGRLKLLQNGQVSILTSSSQRLFHHISIKHVFSKIILSAVKAQLKVFNDGGLYCALFILKLIHHSASLNHTLPLVGTLFNHFSNAFLQFLKAEDHSTTSKVDFSNLQHLKSIVLTVLSSKPGCLLTLSDKNHLCSLLLRAFLNIVPNEMPTSAMILDNLNISFLTVEGLYVRQSKLFLGTLVQLSKIDSKEFLEKNYTGGPFTVVLFTCSLAGDVDCLMRELEVSGSLSIVEANLKHLESIIARLILRKVHFVFCQKVIHPRIKKQLQNAQIMVLDRLGSEVAKRIQCVSGGSVNDSLSCEMLYGSVSSVRSELIGKKSFLLLCNDDIPFFSLVLVHCNQEACAELQVVCRQAIDALFRVLRSSRVCFGGGCTEVHTALLLLRKVKENLDAIQQEVGCTTGLVLDSLVTFVRSITDVCVTLHQGTLLDFATETANGHLWRLHEGHFPTGYNRCECGRYAAATVVPTSWSLLSDIGRSYREGSLSPKDTFPSSVTSDQLSFISSLSDDTGVSATGILTSSITTGHSLVTVAPSSTNSSPSWSPVTDPLSLTIECSPTNIPPSSATSFIEMTTDGLDFNQFICLDELSCKVNSLSLAFETAELLLRTSVYVNNLT